MRNIWLIARREYHHYFISPIAYAVAFAILLILGIIFYANIVGAMLQQELRYGNCLLPLVSLLIFTRQQSRCDPLQRNKWARLNFC